MAGSDVEAKVVVLGSQVPLVAFLRTSFSQTANPRQGVGKTSLVHRYVKNAFAKTTSTVGASFLTKKVVDIDTSTVVRLQIWDTAGQERYRSISKLYYRGKSQTLHLAPHRHIYLQKSCSKGATRWFAYTVRLRQETA